MKRLLGSAALAALLAFSTFETAQATVTTEAVVKNYADIAQAKYEASLSTAKALQAAIVVSLANPSAESLAAARTAQIATRHPYQQIAVYRFGNAILADREGNVNAWPFDEGLIDYVDGSYGTESDENPFFVVNALVAQSGSIEEAVTVLGLKVEVEGSNSLDNPKAVQ